MTDLADRLNRLGEKSKQKNLQRQIELQKQAEDLRMAMPETSAFVDAFRQVFGDDCKLVCADENGKKVKSKRRMAALGLSD